MTATSLSLRLPEGSYLLHSIPVFPSNSVFHAVRIGRIPGVYLSYSETQEQVTGYPGNKHKRYASPVVACAFVWGEDWVDKGPWLFSFKGSNFVHVPNSPCIDLTRYVTVDVVLQCERAANHFNARLYPHAEHSQIFMQRRALQLERAQRRRERREEVGESRAESEGVREEAIDDVIDRLSTVRVTDDSASQVRFEGQFQQVTPLASDIANRRTLRTPPGIAVDRSAHRHLSSDTLYRLNALRFDDHAVDIIATVLEDSRRDRQDVNVVRFLSQIVRAGLSEGEEDLLEALGLRLVLPGASYP